MNALEEIGPTIAEKLTFFRSAFYEADGTRLELVELSADQVADVWAELEAAEADGRMMDVYRLLVLHGTYHADAPVFSSLEQVKRLPARHLVPMGEKLLELCELGVDSGEAPGDPDET